VYQDLRSELVRVKKEACGCLEERDIPPTILINGVKAKNDRFGFITFT
jgi:hypothetical protein